VVIDVPVFTGSYYREWRPAWASGVNDQFTLAEATAFGVDFEIGVFHNAASNQQLASSSRVDNMHAGAASAGHECAVCAYVNGTYAEAGADPDSGEHEPREFLPSGNGAEPYFVDSGGTWLMDPRSKGWRDTCDGTGTSVPDQYHARRAPSFMTTTHCDGGMLDSLGWGIVGTTYNDRTNAARSSTTPDVAPVNPQTGNQWQSATEKGLWTKFTVGLIAGTSGKRGSEGGHKTLVWCNGASRGTRWFDADGPTWVLARCAQLVAAESWLRDATEAANFSALQPLNDWIADVNYIVDCQALGRGAAVWTKVWGNHTHDDDTTVVADPAANTLTATAHGLTDGVKVGFGGSTTVPGGLTDSKVYWVVNSTANTFKVSASSGGSAIDLTSTGTSVKVRRIISQNADDDGDDTNITRWHRLFVGSFMLATNGRSFAAFVHDNPNGNQRIPADRWRGRLNAMGAPTESFTAGLGVWATVAGDTFTSSSHGFAVGQQVIVDGDKQPGGIAARTAYFVRQVATNTFKLATTNSDGTIVTTTSAGANLRVRSKDGSTGGLAAAKDGTATNLYVRRFLHGIVIVNPTGAATLNTFTLPGGTWYDLDDTPYTGSITVDSTKYAVALRDAP
jgi:hypothetical protein